MKTRTFAVAAFVIAIAVLPIFAPPFAAFQLTFAGAYAIAILGLVVLIGESGQISLGHGAFMAGGGYGVAILLKAAGVPYIVSIPIAALACGVLGIGLGVIALRLASIYLALATFALGASVPALLKHFGSVTGGVQGLLLPSLHAPARLQAFMHGEVWWYYVTWATAGLLFAIAYAALRSRIGRSLRAIRDSEVAAVSFGVNPVFYKTLAFGWSAAYAGVAGALLAVAGAYVSPDAYSITLSLTLLVGVVLGGLDMMWGAVIGGLAIEYLPLWVQKVNPALSAVVYGVALVVIMTFMPGGIAGGIDRLLHAFRFQARESRQTVPIAKDLSS
jgi:branched-chain amino acid transport system permease protein